MPENIDCYDYPEYWDLAFSDDTQLEADFIEAAAGKYCSFPVKSLYEPGCGGGRLVVELASRGYGVTACDTNQRALDYLAGRLAEENLDATLAVADMTSFCPDRPVDLAFNAVNTFRHLLSEADARTHLEAVAACLRPGGLYIIGLHLLPLDADEDDSEQWAVEEGNTRVELFLEVVEFSRATRLERIRFELDVRDEDTRLKLQTTYTLRIYLADQIRDLLDSVPQFELLDVYDFWYDIEEPLQLDDSLGDTVLVLRKTV